MLAVEPLGIAYSVTNLVEAVEPGSPVAKAGLVAGDMLTAAQFDPITDEAKKYAKELFREFHHTD